MNEEQTTRETELTKEAMAPSDDPHADVAVGGSGGEAATYTTSHPVVAETSVTEEPQVLQQPSADAVVHHATETSTEVVPSPALVVAAAAPATHEDAGTSEEILYYPPPAVAVDAPAPAEEPNSTEQQPTATAEGQPSAVEYAPPPEEHTEEESATAAGEPYHLEPSQEVDSTSIFTNAEEQPTEENAAAATEEQSTEPATYAPAEEHVMEETINTTDEQQVGAEPPKEYVEVHAQREEEQQEQADVESAAPQHGEAAPVGETAEETPQHDLKQKAKAEELAAAAVLAQQPRTHLYEVATVATTMVDAVTGNIKTQPPTGNQAADEVTEVWEPNDQDVLSGRGASVNAHGGNKTFRALCFARQPEFKAGNHAAKRRVAAEIVATVMNGGTARFLKRKSQDKGPWYVMTKDQAELKACQVMRDYRRPDRLAIKEMMNQNGKERKRSRSQAESTPMLDIPIPTGPLEPIIENPFGVHDHDILSGRGAFVNGHVGNHRLRTLAMERKAQFDAGNYTEKRALATEIVQIIKSLDPPGRFLKRMPKSKASEIKSGENQWNLPARGLDGSWEELNDEKSIHKACQVMRDIDRPDRKEMLLRRATKKQKKQQQEQQRHLHVVNTIPVEAAGGGAYARTHPTTTIIAPVDDSKAAINAAAVAAAVAMATTDSNVIIKDAIDSSAIRESAMSVLAETTVAEKAAVDEAVAATEEALDKALDAVPNTRKPPPPPSPQPEVTGQTADV